MNDTTLGTRIKIENILFLTDFSQASDAALPFALAIASDYRATIHVLHVLTPAPLVYMAPDTVMAAIEAQEECAEAQMQRVRAQLVGVPSHSSIVRGTAVWPMVRQTVKLTNADLVVLGTHGRSGMPKLLLGSFAEEIFRCSPVPVLTIGPHLRDSSPHGGRFQHVLFATDFTAESLAAAPYAISLAEENQARLTLLHVDPRPDQRNKHAGMECTTANVIYQLYGLVPGEAESWCRPEAVVEYGEPAERIVATAKSRDADLIVLGVRHPERYMGAAIHLEGSTAHGVVAHAHCPVLTTRG
jgi:nucleotide-binding universal stress UspA family protein